ncbi:MAG: hypothetical protein LAO24_04320 [Acidobacteriia bacterium]|nr:hypothetical protein [Terriglobia bacterium]
MIRGGEPYSGAANDEDAPLSGVVSERYRCPAGFLDFYLSGELSSDQGYFRFGENAICYGRTCSGTREASPQPVLYDRLQDAVIEEGKVKLPFDPTEIIENLRRERYPQTQLTDYERALKRLYYQLRPFTNQWLRKRIQRFHARRWRNLSFPHWPVDTTVENICETLLLLSLKAKRTDKIPFIWFWPRGARGCVLMTHDVETEAGRKFCNELLDINDSFGVKASFQIVPEDRYAVPASFLDAIRSRGCEIAIQDLNHDGRLFDDKTEFLRRVALIHRYATEYGAKGFRAAVLYRKAEWYGAIKLSFDMSIPNVAHLDPQRGGCCTVMPYFIGDLLELPVTTVQDYTLFHLLNERSIDLWKTQVELILERHGLATFIVHPDYVSGPDTRGVYESLLGWLREESDRHNLWTPLPSEVDSWWRKRSRMSVVQDGDSWRIEGEGADRAVLAFARNANDRLVYELADTGRAHSSH